MYFYQLQVSIIFSKDVCGKLRRRKSPQSFRTKGYSVSELLLELCSLADSVSEVVELASSYLTVSDDLYAVNNR